MRERWTREQVITAIQAQAACNGGRPPSISDWSLSGGTTRKRAVHPHFGTVRHLFGSWNAAIAAAGYEPRKSGAPASAWTREQVITAIQAHAAHNGGRPPSVADWPRALGEPGEPGSNPPYSAVCRLFGYWGEALRAAGYEPPHGRKRALSDPERAWTKEKAIAAIQAYVEHNGRSPSAREWVRKDAEAPPRPVATTVIKLFGSWSAGLRAAGFEPRKSGAPVTWPAERVIAAIQAHAEANGGQPPRTSDWEHAGPGYPAYGLAKVLFGSWAAAVRAAGFEPRRNGSGYLGTWPPGRTNRSSPSSNATPPTTTVARRQSVSGVAPA